MLELLTGTGLATAAGMNAYIPLLVVGSLARWTDLVDTPAGWEWLSGGWVLATLALLLVVEVVADKVPGIDHVNDIVQTVVRPVAGGIAFGAGSGAQTRVVSDPASFFSSSAWVPVVLGILLALAVHFTKASVRPVVTVVTAGVGTPLVSAAEDASSTGLSFAALLAPLLVLVLLAALGAIAWRLLRARRRRTSGAAGGRTPPPAAPA